MASRPLIFNLDAERTFPAYFSGLLLLFGGGVALAAAWGPATSSIVPQRLRAPLMCFSLLLIWMSFYEVMEVHEKLERLTGVDWQTLYSPLIIAAIVSWFVLVRRVAFPAERRALVGGAICWGIAQVLEKVQWDGDTKRSHYGMMMVNEEALEMIGSALFLIALATAYQRFRSRGQGAAR